MRILRTVVLAILFGVGLSAVCPQASGNDVPADGIHHPKGRSHGVYQLGALRQLLEGRFSPVDSLSLVVIRVSFSDRDFTVGSDSVPHDSLYYSNELRHLSEYYIGASLGHFHLEWDLVSGIVALSRPEGYYGEDGIWDARMAEMLMEVVEATDSLLDYTRYDGITLIHAGSGQETDFNGDSPEQLWSGFIDPEELAEIIADTLGTPGIPTNDSLHGQPFFVDNVMVWPEDSSQDDHFFGALGVYAYQVGLRLGMIPLFDTTPSSFPNSQGIGTFGLMGYGLYNAVGFIPAFPCAFHRYLMGWVEPVDVAEDGTLRLTNINIGTEGDTSLVRIPIHSTEYLLLANRVHDTDFDGVFDFIDLDGDGIPENEDTLRGAEFDFFLTSSTNPSSLRNARGAGASANDELTGSGLMIWHIDESVIVRALQLGGYPEDNPSRKGVDLEEADGIQDLDRPGGIYAFGSYYDSFREGNNDRFGNSTNPSSVSNSGVHTGVEVYDISAPAPVMQFSLRFTLPDKPVRTEFNGWTGGVSPIPADVDGVGGEDIIVPADTGFVYVVPGADSLDWSGHVNLSKEIPGAVWSGSPVICDVDDASPPEIFITSTDGYLYAFHFDGTPYHVDSDDSPGALKLHGSCAVSPMVVEADGDTLPEVLALSSSEDSSFAYLIGCSDSWPGTNGAMIADGVIELPVLDGRVISHPARGSVIGPGSDLLDGFYVSTVDGEGRIHLHYVPLISEMLPLEVVEPFSAHVPGGREPGFTLTPASGDLDRDGSDEMVIAFPGNMLVYYRPPSSVHWHSLRSSHPSPPVLADVTGDGVLETIIRDKVFLYLLTDQGIPVTGWPLRLSESLVEFEVNEYPAPPVVGDVQGDGRDEIIFRIGGDLYAYDVSGNVIEGWPRGGEGCSPSSPALLRGQDGIIYLFITGSFQIIGEDRSGVFSVVSSMRRYAIEDPSSADLTWPFYRHDKGGSSRQFPSTSSHDQERFVDPETFICYPNPAEGKSITLRISLFAPARVRIQVLNIEGEKVVELQSAHDWFEGSEVPFEQEISTDLMSSGIYICYVELEGDGWQWRGSTKFAVIR